MLVYACAKREEDSRKCLPWIERQQRMLHMRPHDDMRATKQENPGTRK
jgi:hypothetical protein